MNFVGYPKKNSPSHPKKTSEIREPWPSPIEKSSVTENSQDSILQSMHNFIIDPT